MKQKTAAISSLYNSIAGWDFVDETDYYERLLTRDEMCLRGKIIIRLFSHNSNDRRQLKGPFTAKHEELLRNNLILKMV